MTPYLEHARLIAGEAHVNQMYNERENYIDAHIEPVVFIIRRLGYGAMFQAAGLLHDTVEDTDVTLEYLHEQGMPLEVVHAVDLLTKKDDVPHDVYMEKILTSIYATVAKFADSSANFASTMIHSHEVPERLFRKRCAKYVGNLAILRTHMPEPEY